MLTGAGGLLGDFFSLAIQTLVVMVLVYVLLRDGQAILQRLTRFVLLDHKAFNGPPAGPGSKQAGPFRLP